MITVPSTTALRPRRWRASPVPPPTLPARESDHYWSALSASSQEMSRRPQTIGYSLADSPVGLASWIHAMFQDVGGSHDEHGDAAALFSLDEVLDDVMLSWLPDTGASAARMYWEAAQTGWSSPGTIEEPLTVPVGLSIMPGEYVRRSRRWAERRYTDLVFCNEVARGGHFAALEQPDLLVATSGPPSADCGDPVPEASPPARDRCPVWAGPTTKGPSQTAEALRQVTSENALWLWSG